MNEILHDFSEWLEDRGILSDEKRYFLKDVYSLMDNNRRPSLQFLNQELEEFGWGVQILNETVFNQMLLLHQHKFF